MMTRKSSFLAVLCLVTLLGLASLALAANEVFLSNDTAESEATYVVQFEATVKGNIDKIRVTLPPGSNAANAALGRLFIGDKGFEGDDDDKKDVQLSLDGPDTLVIDLRDDRSVKVGTKILVELFNLNNPVAGNHAIDVTTVNKKGNVLEVVPPIAYSTFAGSGTGDITAVNTPAGSGLTGGAANGDVTLNVDTSQIQKRVTGICSAGSSIREIDASGNVICETDDNSGGTVTSVGTGAGLTGGPITTTGTIGIATGGVTSAHIADGTIGSVDVNSAQIQLRITGNCTTGNAIQVVNQDGTVTCQSVGSGGGVTAVTASAPLASTGGTTPNISLPNVIIGSSNTAIGTNALPGNTGFNNTASGVEALQNNTTGNDNTASGENALRKNDAGSLNTASGSEALSNNTTGSNNTAIGRNALLGNNIGSNNTAIGFGADVSLDNDLTNATAIGNGAIVDASNKIRLGNDAVTVIEAQVDLTVVSDKTKKENFQTVDGEEVLKKIQGFSLTSWNFIGHDPKQFRHYGPMAQDFFAAFGNDGVGTVGTETTINSGDMAGILMIAVQALERQNRDLKSRVEELERLVKDRPYLTASSEPVQ